MPDLGFASGLAAVLSFCALCYYEGYILGHCRPVAKPRVLQAILKFNASCNYCNKCFGVPACGFATGWQHTRYSMLCVPTGIDALACQPVAPPQAGGVPGTQCYMLLL
ncbi:uncharacterized protein C8Q71DRAFT_172453 [Rhodofomes roseus]|uniref:Uncharacterized protein n=1 Tax=Rhodofomes roseus TaxID=34475 RepID=A0ABQ8K8U9_9APHY|nr:uncharacterized protein C8Q71DRAFT_172453 [Rhodofomes roseus]KAH9833741.1 hypothetical protein C8Q71DRAFT_172453 [Rhodofomes roseus]